MYNRASPDWLTFLLIPIWKAVIAQKIHTRECFLDQMVLMYLLVKWIMFLTLRLGQSVNQRVILWGSQLSLIPWWAELTSTQSPMLTLGPTWALVSSQALMQGFIGLGCFPDGQAISSFLNKPIMLCFLSVKTHRHSKLNASEVIMQFTIDTGLLYGFPQKMAHCMADRIWKSRMIRTCDSKNAAAKSLQLCLTLRPHKRQPTRLRRPWDSPGKNTGVGCHFLVQCMKVKSESEVAQSCPTRSDPVDCSPPGSSIHGIFQARVLEWGAIAFSVFLQ